MNDETPQHLVPERRVAPSPLKKFSDPDWTTTGERRASVPSTGLKTLWVNTGTICNIECANCYIESSQANDRIAWFTIDDLRTYLDEARALNLPVDEIGFTGGEPFINPHAGFMIAEALMRGLKVMVLTNAMKPMMLPKVQEQLLKIQGRFGDALTLRVSLDHYTSALHDAERGPGSFDIAMKGIAWLKDNGFKIDVAGRTCFNENESEARAGFEGLFASHDLAINAQDPAHLMLFPEMDEAVDVAEITTQCWDLLGKDPADIMCASSRMVLRRKGAAKPVVLPCTLLAYDANFEMGQTLEQSLTADSSHFDNGAVKLNHRHCAKFCVLGGGSCTA